MGSALRCRLALVVFLSGCSADFNALSTNGDPPIVPVRPSGLSAGNFTSAYIIEGALWGAGGSSNGELGFVSNAPTTTVTLIDDTHAWAKVGLGYEHGCALTTTGEVYCWGSNAVGQLGQGDRIDRVEPTRVTLPASATNLVVHFQTSCAMAAGDLYCWGYNQENALPTTALFTDLLTPALVLPAQGEHFVNAGIGQGHVCAIADNGTLQCSGRNTVGELGDTSLGGQSAGFVKVGSSDGWWDVIAGQDLSCGLRDGTPGVEGELWCWGDNSSGQIGSADRVNAAPPTRVGDRLWRTVDTDTFAICALDGAGSLACAGRDAEGQFGFGFVYDDIPTLTEIGTGVRAFSTGRFHTCFVKDDGALYCAGKNDNGELGVGDTDQRREFTLVPAP